MATDLPKAGVMVALFVWLAPAALAELEQAGVPRDGAHQSVRKQVVSPAIEPEIAREITRLRALVSQLESSPGDLPMLVKSEKQGGSTRGDVYSIVGQPFELLRAELADPAAWCQLLPLHFNVKACTYLRSGDPDILTLYLGRKFYQPIARTRVLELEFSAAPGGQEFLAVRLGAETGPIGTTDYTLSLFAIPLDAARSLIHLRYSYRYGLVSGMVMYGYLRTLGRDKVGFSIVGEEADGTPIRVKGEQAVIERNAVRYHFAVQAYLETLELPASLRFERRLSRWYELTDVYPEQLHEMERPEYLGYKRRERADQATLQAELPTAAGH